jgi:hypothetical protein
MVGSLTLRVCSVKKMGVDLLVIQLKTAIRKLLDDKGVRGRVLDKVNRYGEVVIGVILERPVSRPEKRGDDEPAEAGADRDREGKKAQ